MSLTVGSSVGPYEISAPIGAGGMGEVYRARDTKLNRDVAIKVLPADLARDHERVTRFRREAQVLASLNHPNIAAIYGLEEAEGAVALAMELVEGEDLAERLKRGAIPLDEALAIAGGIADGLAEAHEHGIIHRDLKPANVMVTPDGKVKVLDFGLAKALEGDPGRGDSASSQISHSPTMSRHMTEAGMVLGTAAYMSPEQARGKTVDRRADMWAFGVVLFEMLSGRRLFSGETVSDTLAAVLRDDIPWARLPADTPRAVIRLIRRSLNRDPARRLRSAADARIELDEAKANELAESSPPSVGKAAPISRTPWVLAGVLGLVLLGTWSRSLLTPPPPVDLTTSVKIELTQNEPLASVLGANAALSPDGRSIVFVTEKQGETLLNVRRLDQLEATPLLGTEGARSPFFSPDGRWIGFASAAGLMKIGVAGGARVKLADLDPNLGRGASWFGDTIVFALVNGGLLRVPADGGEPVPLTTLDTSRDERSHRWPSFLPGGRTALFMVQHTGQDYEDGDIEAVSLNDGHRTVLVRGGSFPRFAPGGFLLFARNRVLYSLPFDPETLAVENPPIPVIEGLLGWTGNEAADDGSSEFTLSTAGDLLYRASEGRELREGTDFVWVDPATGRETPAFHELLYPTTVEISPNGQQVAILGRSPRGPGLFIKDLTRGTLTPFTSDGAGETSAVWSPDGKRLAYGPRRGPGPVTLRVRTLNGSEPELVLNVPNSNGVGAQSWTPDGSDLLVGTFSPETGNDIQMLPLDGGAARTIVASPRKDTHGQVSPDGRWMAYTGEEKGLQQAFLVSLTSPSVHYQASVRGARNLRWSRDGRTLYFVETGSSGDSRPEPLMALPVDTRGEEPRFGVAREIYRALMISPGDALSYDVHPDGRLLFIKRQRQEAAEIDSRHVILVNGWAQELERKMSEAR